MSGNIGKIGWIDMTVADATGLRDFYKSVVGWKVEDTNMGDYSDYTMMAPDDGDAIAGICHAQGSNAEIPGGRFCVIEDPGGATAALYQP